MHDRARQPAQDESAGPLACAGLVLAGLLLLGFAVLGVVTFVRWWL
ncbi:hypothetical protein ACFVVA_15750 [Kitasatospora sp. NPDC058048]